LLFFWKLESGDPSVALRIVTKLRQEAVELRWEPVSEVVHLADDQCLNDNRLDKKFLLIGADDTCLAPHEVIYFNAFPPGDQLRPFGLAAYPTHIEGDNQVVPTQLPRWCWVGMVHTHDLEAAQQLMQVAADLGLDVTVS
jgi:hypothetical protein